MLLTDFRSQLEPYLYSNQMLVNHTGECIIIFFSVFYFTLFVFFLLFGMYIQFIIIFFQYQIWLFMFLNCSCVTCDNLLWFSIGIAHLWLINEPADSFFYLFSLIMQAVLSFATKPNFKSSTSLYICYCFCSSYLEKFIYFISFSFQLKHA